MKKALINAPRILHVVAPEDIYLCPHLPWIDVPDDTTERDTYVNGAVVKEVLPVPLTVEELEAQALGALNGGASGVNITKLLKAKFISDLAFRLGKTPGTLTGAELQAERNRIANIYKAL